MNAIFWNSRVRRWLFAALWLLLVGLLAHASGLRINPTPSLPKGVYRLAPEHSSTDLAKGELVSFCLRGEFAELAKERGYLQAGSCDNGLRPLLKRLAGLPGDQIDVSALAIRSMDSQGQPMPSILHSGVIPTGMALVLADHEGSFDSRYFGLVPLEALQRVEPVMVASLAVGSELHVCPKEALLPMKFSCRPTTAEGSRNKPSPNSFRNIGIFRVGMFLVVEVKNLLWLNDYRGKLWRAFSWVGEIVTSSHSNSLFVEGYELWK